MTGEWFYERDLLTIFFLQKQQQQPKPTQSDWTPNPTKKKPTKKQKYKKKNTKQQNYVNDNDHAHKCEDAYYVHHFHSYFI